jgi:hypothetical protein
MSTIFNTRTTPVPITKKIVPATSTRTDYSNTLDKSFYLNDFIEDIVQSTTMIKDDKTNTFFVVKDNVGLKVEDDVVDVAVADLNGNVIDEIVLEKDVSEKVKENEKPSIIIPYDSMKDSYLMQFYIGSLTVIGLFVLFRMIQKTR